MRILSINDIMRIPRAHNPSCSALRGRRLTEGFAGLPVKVLAAGRHELRAQGRRLRANAKAASRFAVAYRTGVLMGRSRDATKAYQDRPIATTRDGGDRGDGVRRAVPTRRPSVAYGRRGAGGIAQLFALSISDAGHRRAPVTPRVPVTPWGQNTCPRSGLISADACPGHPVPRPRPGVRHRPTAK